MNVARSPRSVRLPSIKSTRAIPRQRCGEWRRLLLVAASLPPLLESAGRIRPGAGRRGDPRSIPHPLYRCNVRPRVDHLLAMGARLESRGDLHCS